MLAHLLDPLAGSVARHARRHTVVVPLRRLVDTAAARSAGPRAPTIMTVLGDVDPVVVRQETAEIRQSVPLMVSQSH